MGRQGEEEVVEATKVEVVVDTEVGIVVGTRVEEEEEDPLQGSRGIMDTEGGKRGDRLYDQDEWNQVFCQRNCRIDARTGLRLREGMDTVLVEASVSF
jgi:hypothetical protein